MTLLLKGAGKQTPAAAGGGASYSTEVLADSPLLYWRLGEGSGTNANDETANNRDGTYSGATLGTAGALAGDANTAVTLDGVDDKITSAYNPFTGQRTFEGWAWRDGSTWNTLFSSDAAGHPYLRLTDSSQTVVWEPNVSTDITVSWAAAWPGNAQWVHWVLTFDNATFSAELYLNGSSQGTRAVGYGYNATPGNYLVGARGGSSNYLAGRLDEVAVYSGILSSARVTAHYDAGT